MAFETLNIGILISFTIILKVVSLTSSPGSSFSYIATLNEIFYTYSFKLTELTYNKLMMTVIVIFCTIISKILLWLYGSFFATKLYLSYTKISISYSVIVIYRYYLVEFCVYYVQQISIFNATWKEDDADAQTPHQTQWQKILKAVYDTLHFNMLS